MLQIYYNFHSIVLRRTKDEIDGSDILTGLMNYNVNHHQSDQNIPMQAISVLMDSVVAAKDASCVEISGCNTITQKPIKRTTEILQARGSSSSLVRTRNPSSEEADPLVDSTRHQYHPESKHSLSECVAFMPNSLSDSNPITGTINLNELVGDRSVPSPYTSLNPNDGISNKGHLDQRIYNAGCDGVQIAHSINIVNLNHEHGTSTLTQTCSVVKEQTNNLASEQIVDHGQSGLRYHRQVTIVDAHSMSSVVNTRVASNAGHACCNTVTPRTNKCTTEISQARGSTSSSVRTRHPSSEDADPLLDSTRQQYHPQSKHSWSECAAFMPRSSSDNIPETGRSKTYTI